MMLKYTFLVILLAYVNSAVENEKVRQFFHIFFLVLVLGLSIYMILFSWIK